MDRGYEAFCLADPLFYDSPMASRGDDADLAVAGRPVPEGWSRYEQDDWLVYGPDDARRPAQGWKIHASARLEDAERIAAAVWDYCVPRRIPFKFVRSLQLLLLRNAKYADRGASGKFVTIYPADEAELETVLTELGERLRGVEGPYILSDLRWGDGPLFVRYGGFAERWCLDEGGETHLALEDGSGRLVPDRRGVIFSVPDWVTLPAFLEPHLAARNGATVEDIPYRIEEALHFSNGGGVYAGTDSRTGERVVLKEARPHAGLSADRADAVTRLLRERDMLRRLAGLELVPEYRDHLILGGHHFLVEEFVDGTPLRAMIVERFPLMVAETDPSAAAAYAAWALDVVGRLEAAVERVHERGVVVGDLHPENVLVRADGRPVLIDLEVASDVGEGRRPALADPSFAPPSTCAGFAIDRYALACLRLFVFMPLTSLVQIDARKADDLAAAIAQAFPTVPAGFLREAAEVITGAYGPAAGPPRRRPELVAAPEAWPELRDAMARAILASATPERDDRLFPGDVRQFSSGGLNLAYGAAGVLHALAATGAGRVPEHEDWLVRRATRPSPGVRFGLLDGLHGVAWALERLGRTEDALHVLEICRRELAGKWPGLGIHLAGGIAGMALNLLHFADVTGDAGMLDEALAMAEAVAGRLGDEGSVGQVSGGAHPYAGLIRGSSGPALLFLRLFERSGDEAFLDRAAVALRQDLRRCVPREDGSLEVDEGWRTMPYLADGSAGIGLVVDRYLAHRADPALAEASGRIRLVAESQFYVEPGLLYGRAGMILALTLRHPSGTAWADPVVAAQVRRLAWHAVPYAGGLAFPGEQLLRLSMDLASGTAGVLLAVGAAVHGEPIEVPFIPQVSPTGAAHRAAPVTSLDLERR